MSNKKELSYPSLQTVMEYLEANQRFKLVQHCPCLKFIDRATPLLIDYLSLTANYVSVNFDRYDVGVLRHFPKNHPDMLKKFVRESKNGGTLYDLDKFGRRDWSYDKIRTPGDIFIEPSSDSDPRERTPEDEAENMEDCRQRLAHLKTLRRMKQRQKEIERHKASLYTWQLSQDNILPPYKMYLMYTRNYGDKQDIEYFEYSKKMYEGMKHLYTAWFGGRKCPIIVRSLKVPNQGGVLRLPESIRIKAREISIGTKVESVMNSIGHLLVNTPTEVTITGGSNLEANFKHPLLKAASILNIPNMNMTGELFQVILQDTHRNIWVQKGKLTNEEYLQLIDKMIEDKRAIGTQYGFGVHSKKQVKELINLLKERPGLITSQHKTTGCSRFPYYYSLPIDDKTVLAVCCWKCGKSAQNWEPWSLWLIVFCRLKAEASKVKK